MIEGRGNSAWLECGAHNPRPAGRRVHPRCPGFESRPRHIPHPRYISTSVYMKVQREARLPRRVWARRDSNPGSPAPKAGALSMLGHGPLLLLQLECLNLHTLMISLIFPIPGSSVKYNRKAIIAVDRGPVAQPGRSVRLIRVMFCSETGRSRVRIPPGPYTASPFFV